MSELLTRFSREIFEITDESLIIVLCTLVLVATAIVVYWLYNRKRLHELGHQIPAAVLKSYLDSIIQNSTALKSSLFRGGGLEIGEGIPSVVASHDLPSSSSIVSGGASSEELNQKIAQIAVLTKQLSDKDLVITQLEHKLSEASGGAPVGDNSGEVDGLNAEITILKARIAELEAAPAPEASGDVGDGAKLAEITKERDELKERLLEYEIIEEDLANLKRLQQENDQLRSQLAAGAPAEAVEPEATEEVPPAEDMDEGLDLEAAMAAAITESEPAAEEEPAGEAEAVDNGDVPDNEGEQKSSAELLSEFEKMLG